MKLHDLFGKVAIKRLSRVEVSPGSSHQHEMNGVRGLIEIFGCSPEKKKFPATLVYVTDSNDMEADFPIEIEISGEGEYVTWYDARARHPERTEYRLYYSSSLLIERGGEGDLLVVGFDGKKVWMIVAEAGSEIERQILWLFTEDGLLAQTDRFSIRKVPERPEVLAGIEKMLLEALGIEIPTDTHIDPEQIIHEFDGKFPSTRSFSEYARKSTGIEVSTEDPDGILMVWWNREEELFRALEKHIVQDRIDRGFHEVDEFVSFALSVINRRKSRAGQAFENHLEQVFIDYGLTYSRGKTTEKKSKPDFVFPSIDIYHRAKEEEELIGYLTVLGAKTSCKDRWRQVTKEARLVEEKHLVTLEPAISESQTDEMRENRVQLVVPRDIIYSYSPSQQDWILEITDLLELLREKQERLASISLNGMGK